MLEDGSFLAIDTYDGTLDTAKYSNILLGKSTHKFQPDKSVYYKYGTSIFKPGSGLRRKVLLSKNEDLIIVDYKHISSHVFSKEKEEFSGTNTYKRISDTN